MGAPNVYDTTYVNSGPGVGLSAGGNSGSYSNGSGYSGNETDSKQIQKLALSMANQAHTGTSSYAQSIRDHFVNPSTSARSAMDYEDYIGSYGSNYDMDEYYDMLMDIAKYNNDWSAAQADKQMNFQKWSDYYAYKHSHDEASRQMEFQNEQNKFAMNWSAAEAQKSRDWTKMMSDTAHQREVKDLIAAGLNPILSANTGAYVGSGATGQAFSGSGASGQGYSSNGAMGQTDTSVTGALSGLMQGVMSTARDIAITKLGVEAQKYHTDMQYSMSKMATEASIYNNNNSVTAQKAIAKLNSDTDLQKADISANATKSAAAASAGALMSAAATNAAAAKYSADQHRASYQYSSDKSLEASKYASDKRYEGTKYATDWNFRNNPIGYVGATVNQLADVFSDIDHTYSYDDDGTINFDFKEPIRTYLGSE